MRSPNASKNEIEAWVKSQSWYQNHTLSNGIIIPGKIDSSSRLAFFKNVPLEGKRVLDIGCNSGFYCLWSKQQGAAQVTGIDIDAQRIAQAKELAVIENLEIDYQQTSLFHFKSDDQFDVIFCFAVLTEIQDLLGALAQISKLCGSQAFIELSLAKPVCYLSRSRTWLKSLIKSRSTTELCELRQSKRGWMISPSLSALKKILGPEMTAQHLGAGPRYDMLHIQRR